MSKQDLMKELLNRYEQQESIKNTDNCNVLDMYIEKLERKLIEILEGQGSAYGKSV